jgi:hypothetical protein
MLEDSYQYVMLFRSILSVYKHHLSHRTTCDAPASFTASPPVSRDIGQAVSYQKFVIWDFVTFCSYTYMLFKLNTKAENHEDNKDTFKTFIQTFFITNNRLHLDVITCYTLLSGIGKKHSPKSKHVFTLVLHRRISGLLSVMMDEKPWINIP